MKSIKIGPVHLPKGTIFIAKDLPIDYGFSEFEVDHLVCNGPRSYVVVTKQPNNRPELAGDTCSFNIVYIDQIKKRGDGGVTFYSENETRPPARQIGKISSIAEVIAKTHRIRKSEATVPWITSVIPLCGDHHGKFIDEEKLIKHLKAMGFMRTIEARSVTRVFGAVNLVKHRQAAKWLSKNLHRVQCSLSESARINDQMYEELYYRDLKDEY